MALNAALIAAFGFGGGAAQIAAKGFLNAPVLPLAGGGGRLRPRRINPRPAWIVRPKPWNPISVEPEEPVHVALTAQEIIALYGAQMQSVGDHVLVLRKRRRQEHELLFLLAKK
jgi:hypothetical protein